MLLTADAIGDTAGIVSVDHFYLPAHGHIFAAITDLHAAGLRADTVTVADKLRCADLLDAAGGPATLVDLQAATPAATNAAQYAAIVADHALLRSLIGAGSEIIELGYRHRNDCAGAIDEAESMVYRLGQGQLVTPVRTINEVLRDNIEDLEALNAGSVRRGSATGFVDLDAVLGGLHRAKLVIVGARPSMGKTSFALGVASHVAAVENKPVLFFSLEMDDREIGMRLQSMHSHVDSTKLRDGNLTASDWEQINAAIGELADIPLLIDDSATLTGTVMRAKARRLKSRVGDIGLIVVDYIQLMTGRGRAENRQGEVAEISRDLKVLAKELDCPVLALSQLSRSLETRQDKRPVLADLRESGAIEQDADVVLFLYRDEVYHPNRADLGIAEVIVAKNRNGATGSVRLAWRGCYTQFVNTDHLDAAAIAHPIPTSAVRTPNTAAR